MTQNKVVEIPDSETSHKIVDLPTSIEAKPLSLGDVYSLNKELMKQSNQKPLSKSKIREREGSIRVWFGNHVTEFAMLYNKERSDFTLIQLTGKTIQERATTTMLAGQQVIDLLQERGQIISIEPALDDNSFEIWIKDDDEYIVYYLFKYDDAVIKCDEEYLRKRGWLRI